MTIEFHLRISYEDMDEVLDFCKLMIWMAYGLPIEMFRGWGPSPVEKALTVMRKYEAILGEIEKCNS